MKGRSGRNDGILVAWCDGEEEREQRVQISEHVSAFNHATASTVSRYYNESSLLIEQVSAFCLLHRCNNEGDHPPLTRPGGHQPCYRSPTVSRFEASESVLQPHGPSLCYATPLRGYQCQPRPSLDWETAFDILSWCARSQLRGSEYYSYDVCSQQWRLEFGGAG